MRHDILADVLSQIKNADRIGKKECIVPASKLVKEVLTVLQKDGYIGNFDYIDDGKSGKFKLELKNKIIDCNVIKPRFAVRVDEYEKYEKRFLPAREVGLLVVSTSRGIMNHKKAKELHLGGRLLAYCY